MSNDYGPKLDPQMGGLFGLVTPATPTRPKNQAASRGMKISEAGAARVLQDGGCG